MLTLISRSIDLSSVCLGSGYFKTWLDLVPLTYIFYPLILLLYAFHGSMTTNPDKNFSVFPVTAKPHGIEDVLMGQQ